MNDVCGTIMPVLRIIALLIKIIQWAVPIILIVFATFDFVKATMASEDKDMEKAKSSVATRLIYAVVIFLVPVVIRLIFSLISSNIPGGNYVGPGAWINCFEQALNEV